MRNYEVMDVLVEMTHGSGWLAREGGRIVFLPNAESIDTAHDVIEPLLIPRDVDDSFATMQQWIEERLPLPEMILISLEQSVRVLNHKNKLVSFRDGPGQPLVPLAVTGGSSIKRLGQIANLIINDDDEEASGMLVEGVIRAGGLRVHFHRGRGADGLRDTNTTLPVSSLKIELDNHQVEVGNGLVLGRWPYSHPDFDDALAPIIVNDPAVSRLHAIIAPTSTGAELSDQNSHNGTWVIRASGESERVTGDSPKPLHSGEEIRVGDTMLRVL